MREVKKERLRLEYELKLASQQIEIRSLEMKSYFQLDKLLFFLFKRSLRSVFGKVRQAAAAKKGEKNKE